MNPPVAKKIPRDVSAHGIKRVDDYYWLRERDDPGVIAYLEQERDYTRSATGHNAAFRERLYEELVGRIKETDVSAPVGWGDYLYYVRTEEGKQYSIHCRRRRDLDAEEEIILDENELAADRDFLKVGVFRLSLDHKMLAYSTDTKGAETFTLYVKNLETGEVVE